MKKLLAIAFGLALLGATLSTGQAQGTGGSPGKTAHGAKGGHKFEHHRYHRGPKKPHTGVKKGNARP